MTAWIRCDRYPTESVTWRCRAVELSQDNLEDCLVADRHQRFREYARVRREARPSSAGQYDGPQRMLRTSQELARQVEDALGYVSSLLGVAAGVNGVRCRRPSAPVSRFTAMSPRNSTATAVQDRIFRSSRTDHRST